MVLYSVVYGSHFHALMNCHRFTVMGEMAANGKAGYDEAQVI
jgi:hypothetical protein